MKIITSTILAVSLAAALSVPLPAALVAPAYAQDADATPATWVLLGLDVHMGIVTVRDTAADANTVSIYGEGLPVYTSKAACEDVKRRVIRKFANAVHGGGNYGHYVCTDWRKWSMGE